MSTAAVFLIRHGKKRYLKGLATLEFVAYFSLADILPFCTFQ
jgi:hypothetical protein